jgi:hypothetical protein
MTQLQTIDLCSGAPANTSRFSTQLPKTTSPAPELNKTNPPPRETQNPHLHYDHVTITARTSESAFSSQLSTF